MPAPEQLSAGVSSSHKTPGIIIIEFIKVNHYANNNGSRGKKSDIIVKACYVYSKEYFHKQSENLTWSPVDNFICYSQFVYLISIYINIYIYVVYQKSIRTN